MYRKATIIAVTGFAAAWANGQTTKPANDAAKLYEQAAKILSKDEAKKIMPPTESMLQCSENPPMSDAWLRMERRDYEVHEKVRKLVHQAWLLPKASWPPYDPKKPPLLQLSYLEDCRIVSHEIADAAMYQSLILKNQPAAFESLGDLMHLADLLTNQPGENLLRLFVAEGMEAMDWDRLTVITSGLKITQNASNTHDLQFATATK